MTAWKAAQTLSLLPGQLPQAPQQGSGPRGRDNQDQDSWKGGVPGLEAKEALVVTQAGVGGGWPCLCLQGPAVHGQGLFCRAEEKPPPAEPLREPATPQHLEPGSPSENDAGGPSAPFQLAECTPLRTWAPHQVCQVPAGSGAAMVSVSGERQTSPGQLQLDGSPPRDGRQDSHSPHFRG